MTLYNRRILANKRNYGAKRKTSAIKYLIIHYTGNRNDTAQANCKYFQTGGRNASAHYFVDPNEVIQSVPDDTIAWSVGGAKYSNCAVTGGGKYYGKATNANSISIELCGGPDSVKATQATINRALTLTKALMKLYNIPASNVIRHFDVTGKSCPAYWTNDTTWKKEFKNKLTTTKKTKHTYYNKTGLYLIKKIPRVIRAEPKPSGKVVGYIGDKGYYTITEVKGRVTKYGKLKSGAGWICLRDDYVKPKA